MSQRQSRIDWVQSVLGVPIQEAPQETHAQEGGNETSLQTLRRRVKEAIQSVNALLLDEDIQDTKETLSDIHKKLELIGQDLAQNDPQVEQLDTKLGEQVTRIKTIAAPLFDQIHIGPSTENVGDGQIENDDTVISTEDECLVCELAAMIEGCLTATETHSDIRKAMPEVSKLITPTGGDTVGKFREVFRQPPDVVKQKLAELEEHCKVIDQDIRSYLERALQALREKVPFFDAVNPVNPVTRAAAILDQQAVGLTGLEMEIAKQRLWIAKAARFESNYARGAMKVKTRLDKIVGGYEAQMETLSEVSSVKDALAKFKDDILLACVRQRSVEDLESTWEALEQEGKNELKKIFRQATAEATKPEQWIEGLNTMSKAFDKLVKTLSPEILVKIVGVWGLDSQLPKDPSSLKPEMLTKVINETIDSAGKDKEKLGKVNAALQKALAASFDQIITDKSPDALDAFIEGIGDTVSYPVSQSCCVTALKKRFGMDITIPEGVQITRLPELYTLMKRLPEGHVSPKNLKMKTIEYEASSGASEYGQGKISLNHMASKVAPYLDLEQPSKQVEMDYFSAVTLHEIGHSVDDANTVMSGRMGGDDFGSWQEHTPADIADVIYSQYLSTVPVSGNDGLLKDLIKSSIGMGVFAEPMNERDPLFPLTPYWGELGKTGVFDALRSAAGVEGQSWRQVFLKDTERAYHQGYSGKWVSYSLAGRNRSAISVYQYRAPGEWFAEIYARYHVAKPGQEGDPDRQRVRSRVGDAVIAFVTGS